MKKVALALALMLPILLLPVSNQVFAHNETVVGSIKLVAGWGTEPPLLGQLNTVVIQVTRVSDDSPVTNAFASAEVMISKGGVERQLDLRPSEEAGWYEAAIIPTQLGQYAVSITGTIDRQQVNTQIEIEAVEDFRRLNFPESGSSPGEGLPEDFIEQMRSVITSLTLQVEDAGISAQNAREAARSAAESAGETRAAADRAYIIGMVGVGIGIAGVAIAAVALSRKS